MPALRFRGTCASALAATLLLTACSDDPPDKEMRQAQSAIDVARAAGAEEYAHDDLAAAEDALKGAREAVGQRDYRLALNDAIGSREQAEIATKTAADRRTELRTEAERALLEATTALTRARSRLAAAEAARAPVRLLNEARRNIDDGDSALQKARASVSRGAYRDVATNLDGPTARLNSTVRDLDAAHAAATHRRH
jgi:hypothetical protein